MRARECCSSTLRAVPALQGGVRLAPERPDGKQYRRALTQLLASQLVPAPLLAISAGGAAAGAAAAAAADAPAFLQSPSALKWL